jgi:hypothetical protein
MVIWRSTLLAQNQALGVESSVLDAVVGLRRDTEQQAQQYQADGKILTNYQD